MFSSLAKCFVKPFYNVTLNHSPLDHAQLFILNFRQPKQLYFYLLAVRNPKIHLYHICPKKHFLDSLIRWFSAIDFLYAKNAAEVVAAFKKQGRIDLKKGEVPCLVYPFFPTSEKQKNRSALKVVEQQIECSIISVDVQKVTRKEQLSRAFFKRTKITFHFFLN